MPSPPTPTLMVQATGSNAGKSVLVTGLCRLFARRGYSVAPFKPQNMALNSAVTESGGEIGRAQAVQAQAARLPPHTDMNPILLKPNSERGAQVIVNGQPIGNMDAVEYHAYKKTALPFVLSAYQRLAAQHDLVLVEGAGSPAEINLRENDIANMGFANAVDCDVLLVADIERGGVFAHLKGTVDCLSAAERARVKGLVINRFRGDKTLLDSGIEWLTQQTAIPVLGVLPFLPGLYIQAEDSVDLAALPPNQVAAAGAQPQPTRLTVVVPRLPRLSNHTDFDALRLHAQVDLHFIAAQQAIPPCDLIILPGSKNTISDLNWLVAHGWRAAIQRHLRYGGKLIGVCGGYQMVGVQVHDPHGIEGPPGSQAGLGLMQFETTLARRKQLTNVRGNLLIGATPVPLRGYEIHLGVTRGPALARPAIQLDQRVDGVVSTDNQILCSYLHGLFDQAEACTALLKWAGLEAPPPPDYAAMHEQQIDRVADMLEAELDRDFLADFQRKSRAQTATLGRLNGRQR